MALFDPGFETQLEPDGIGAVTCLTVTAVDNVALVAAASVVTGDLSNFRIVRVPATADLVVHGDRVRIVGALALAGRRVKIHTRVLECDHDGAGAGPAIDVSGAVGKNAPPTLAGKSPAIDGTDAKFIFHAFGDDDYKPPIAGISGDPGQDGEQGGRGENAGSIDIRAMVITLLGGATSLALRARGGDGGKGQDGQPGQTGGRGGNGLDGWVGGIFWTNDIREATDGANAGARGANGRGGYGGYGGNGGTVTVLTLDNAPAIECTVGEGQTGVDGGTPSVISVSMPGSGGQGAVARPVGSLVGAVHAGGKPGGVEPLKPQPPQAPRAGTAGTAGSFRITAPAAAADLGVTMSIAQLSNLLDRVRIDQFALQGQTDGASPATLLQQAMKDTVDRLKWLSTLTSASATSSAELNALAAGTAGLATNLGNPGLNPFGKSLTWAPTISLAACRAVLTEPMTGSIRWLTDVEASWGAYRDARNAGRAEDSQRSEAVSLGAQQLARLQAQRTAMAARLVDLVADLRQREATVATARGIVELHLSSFRESVSNHVSVSVDFSDFLSVLEQTAFASTDPEQMGAVGALESAKLALKTVDASNVRGVDGQAVNKDYILSRVDVYGKQVKTLDEAYSVVNGQIRLSDPDAYKLLCTQQQLDELLQTYETVPGADDAREAMDDFVQEVLSRNSAILDYNGLCAAYLQISSDHDLQEQRQRKLGADAAKVDVPVADSYVERLYTRARASCLHDLYLASRAYRFWALRDDTALGSVLASGVSQLTALAAKGVTYGLLVEGAEDLDQDIGNLTVRLTPVVLEFDAMQSPRIITSFRKDRGRGFDGGRNPAYWEFKVPIADKDWRHRPNPFGGMANVRLTEVRVWLLGIPSDAWPNGTAKIHLTQQGDEQLLAPDGSVVTVTHEPVERGFEYAATAETNDLDATAILSRSVYWPKPDNPALPDHTPIGPFATWRVAVRPQDTSGSIDWSRLQKIRVEFFVAYQ